MVRNAELLVQPDSVTGTEVRGIALLLHGGAVNGHGRPSRLAALGLNAPARRLAHPNVVAVAGVAPWLPPRVNRSSNWRADAS
ncbi:hypothetical protein [Streptosporangium saharense]|uniref:hypothetical protein n=1 Tax=Streptosporangium saharense TaxID=1706840 RepID=UPI0033307749